VIGVAIANSLTSLARSHYATNECHALLTTATTISTAANTNPTQGFSWLDLQTYNPARPVRHLQVLPSMLLLAASHWPSQRSFSTRANRRGFEK
jgi:hypothetical protein